MNLFGCFTYEIDDRFSSRLLKYISANKLPVCNMISKNGFLYITVPFELKRDLDNELCLLKAEYSIVKISGLISIIKMLLAKKGMIAGCVIALILINMISGHIFCFEILCDNKQIRSEVMAVLYQDGIRAGYSKKDIDFTAAERDIKKKVDGLSWAGISVQGCKVVVDVVENIEKPAYTQKRLPTNLIAKENGVIEKIELLDGQLLKTVGSGVTKGDVIVSGDVLGDLSYSRKGYVKHFYVHYYTRSLGKIYGSFERKEVFCQPYSISEKAITEEPEEKSFLCLFDVYIPLFFDCEDHSIIGPYEKNKLSFMDCELPVGIRTVKLTEYEISERPLSVQQAEEYSKRLAANYEVNFLSEYEIKDKKYTVDIRNDGVYLTAEYSLFGEISEEVDFFISK